MVRESLSPRDRWVNCPSCQMGTVNIGGEGDEVEYSCPRCDVVFTVAEAIRGQMFVEKERREREFVALRDRVDSLEKDLLTYQTRVKQMIGSGRSRINRLDVLSVDVTDQSGKIHSLDCEINDLAKELKDLQDLVLGLPDRVAGMILKAIEERS